MYGRHAKPGPRRLDDWIQPRETRHQRVGICESGMCQVSLSNSSINHATVALLRETSINILLYLQ